MLTRLILNSGTNRKDAYLLFEKVCAEVKKTKNINVIRGIAQELNVQGMPPIENVNSKNKEELCSEIGARLLISMRLAQLIQN